MCISVFFKLYRHNVMDVRESVFLRRFILSSSLTPLIINVTLTHCILNVRKVKSYRNTRNHVYEETDMKLIKTMNFENLLNLSEIWRNHRCFRLQIIDFLSFILEKCLQPKCFSFIIILFSFFNKLIKHLMMSNSAKYELFH